jgi:hypothetical protein
VAKDKNISIVTAASICRAAIGRAHATLEL